MDGIWINGCMDAKMHGWMDGWIVNGGLMNGSRRRTTGEAEAKVERRT